MQNKKVITESPTKEEILIAIKQGVKESFHEMMESGDGFTGVIRTEQVMEQIKEGVESAFFRCLPFSKELLQAFESGVREGYIEAHD